MYAALHSLFRKLPPSARSGVKRVLGSDGHGESTLDWLTALKDAAGKKRLDRALADLIEMLGTETAENLAGKVCIDFGAGYVPTAGVAMWLLGASEVHGVDYNHIAKRWAIARAIKSADLDHVESELSRLRIGRDWRSRLESVKNWADDGGTGFPPGYNYIAPADVIASPHLLPNFDIIVSTSVLEHIRPSLMVALVDALRMRANEHATHVHRVDLRDHRDFENNPYGFLDPGEDFDAETDADSRGNGMTLDDWKLLLAEHPAWQLVVSDYAVGRSSQLSLAAVAAHGNQVADSVVLRSAAM